MAAVWFRVARVLRRRWRPAVGLALLVAVVGGLVLALVAGTARTVTVTDRYERARGDRWDTAMEQALGRPRTDEVAALPAVDQVASATFVFGGFVDERGEQAEAIVFAGTPEALGGRVVDGRPADPERPGDFVASRSLVDLLGLALGDELGLITVSRRSAAEAGFDGAPDGPTVAARLVGVIASPAELEEDYPVAVFPAALLDEGSIGTSATISLVALTPSAGVTDLREQLDGLEAGDQFDLSPARWVPTAVADAVAVQANALAVAALVTALAGWLAVGQLAARWVRGDSADRSVLVGVGLTGREVALASVLQVVVPVAVGAVGAVVLAVALSGRFPVGFASVIEPAPGIRFEPLVHLTGALALVAGLVPWAAVGPDRAGRTSTRQPRRNLVSSTSTRPALVVGARLASPTSARRAGAARTSWAGVVALAAGVVAAVTFGSGLDDLLDDPVRQGTVVDAYVGQGGGELPSEAVAAVAAVPGVESVTRLGAVTVSVADTSLGLTGFDVVRGDFPIEVLDGDRPTGPGQVALGAVTARRLDVAVGDDLEVATAEGTRRLRVVGLAVVPGVEGTPGLGEGGVVAEETFVTLGPERGFSGLGVEFATATDDDRAEASQRLGEELGADVGRPDPPGVVTNLDRVRAAPGAVALVLLVLFVLSLAGLLLAGLRRRRSDLAVVRALGADRLLLVRSGRWYAVIVGTVVAVLALPVGVAVGRVLFRLLALRVGATDEVPLPVGPLALGLGAGLVFALGVVRWGLWRGRGSVVRALTLE